MNDIEKLLWVEKYRPKIIKDCALPARHRKVFEGVLKTGNIGNMTLVGPAGTGKTTVARALCNELDCEALVINASENGNIDTIRSTVRQFGSGMSFNGKMRVVILDEGDYLTPLAQASLRGMMEELSANCRFIITANFGNKIIEPIISRCPLIDFSYSDDEKIEAIIQADTRLREILKGEEIEIEGTDEDAFSAFLLKHFPDMRTILNILQRACQGGYIEWDDLNGSQDLYDISGLIEAMQSQNFNKIRDWVAASVDRDGPTLRRFLYENLEEVVKPDSLPGIILTINEHDYKEAFVMDKEINTLAMILTIVGDAEFK